MSFRKPVVADNDDPTEEELNAIWEWDTELEAFEIHELPVFLRLLELHTELEPEDALEALQASFYLGLKESNRFNIWWRGKLPVEAAYEMNRIVEDGTSYNSIATWLRNTLSHAREQYEKDNSTE